MPARAFIVRPFGKKKDLGGNEIDFDAVERDLIQPAFDQVDVIGATTVEIAKAGNIREDMFELLVEADLVVADMSIHNANVFYELGIRHALRDKRTFLIRCAADNTPFDLSTDRYLEYDRANPAATVADLVEGLRQTLRSDTIDSPVFRLVPGLTPQDPSKLIVVPAPFAEDVERARVDGGPGDLDLLADEVKLAGLRWMQQGLRVVGQAQFDRRSWEGAKHTWEAIREVYPDDVQANVKLATVYQKLGDLTKSNQAVERALKARPDEGTLAELYALRGSNEKTEWLKRWDEADDEVRRKRALTSAFLERSLEAYRDGFLLDLNHFYSGLNALALLTVRLVLAEALPDEWADEFDTEEEAERQFDKLKERRAELRDAVALSVEATQRRLEREGKTDPWTEISAADLACISGTRAGRVERLYRKALAKPTRQQLDSVDRQLVILERLSVQPEQVAAGRAIVKERREELGDAPEAQGGPARVLIFTGHRVDAPGREVPRFPAAAEPKARAMIEAAIDRAIAGVDGEVIGIAGGASGGDILFHEVCAERNVKTTVYLAGPRNEYVQASVQDSEGDWVDRFDRLIERGPVRYLGDALELPRWLDGVTDYTIWQRNNLWTLHHAMAYGSSKAVLIALWNGKAGDGPGGTADMIERAKGWGARTDILPAAELVG